jgi:TolA-binding protein
LLDSAIGAGLFAMLRVHRRFGVNRAKPNRMDNRDGTQMTSFLHNKPRLIAALVLVLAAPALAQSSLDSGAEARLRKIEAEVGALQRKVFPGGDGTFFPQIQPSTAGAATVGTPATAPSTDMLARMDAIEGQIARLTSQVEESGNKVGLLEGRLVKLEAGAVPAATSAVPAAVATTPALAPKPAPTAKPAVATTKSATPTSARLAAVRAVEKPVTADPGDDEYSYGFRLWEAKFYPEAQQQLKLYLQKYPKHSRISFARNLLGRTYLDEGNFDEAGKWFYENYKADKNGARAPDSVLFLAETWQRKKDTNRVCIALAQFVDDYPAEAAGRLRSQYEGVRGKVKCN